MSKPASGPETLVTSAIAALALVRSAGSIANPPAGPRSTSESEAPRRGRTAASSEVQGTTQDDQRRAGESGRGRHADKPSEIPAAGWKDIAKRVKTEVKNDNVPLLSAGVAFYSLLALFPALVAVVSMYGLVADPGEVATQLKSLTRAMPKEAADLIIKQVRTIASSSSGALGVTVVVGIALALWSASSGMKWLMSALSLIYDEREDRKFVKLRGMALILTVGAAAALVITIGLLAATPSLARAVGLGSVGVVVFNVLKWPLLLALVVAGLTALYRYGPNRNTAKWAWVTWGSGIAAAIWLVASIGFAVYASLAGSFSKNYGSFAGIVVLMLWLYLTVLAILIGAEINSEMEHQTAKDTTTGEPEPLGSRDATMADEVAPATAK